jgi:hypothetical protein
MDSWRGTVQTGFTKVTRTSFRHTERKFEYHGVLDRVTEYPDIKLDLAVPPYWSILNH